AARGEVLLARGFGEGAGSQYLAVIPAQAGIQRSITLFPWIPAFAGMTVMRTSPCRLQRAAIRRHFRQRAEGALGRAEERHVAGAGFGDELFRHLGFIAE